MIKEEEEEEKEEEDEEEDAGEPQKERTFTKMWEMKISRT